MTKSSSRPCSVSSNTAFLYESNGRLHDIFENENFVPVCPSLIQHSIPRVHDLTYRPKHEPLQRLTGAKLTNGILEMRLVGLTWFGVREKGEGEGIKGKESPAPPTPSSTCMGTYSCWLINSLKRCISGMSIYRWDEALPDWCSDMTPQVGRGPNTKTSTHLALRQAARRPNEILEHININVVQRCRKLQGPQTLQSDCMLPETRFFFYVMEHYW